MSPISTDRLVDRISAILYDYRLILTMPSTVDERIVILDIDEKSLKEKAAGRGSRDRLGDLMTSCLIAMASRWSDSTWCLPRKTRVPGSRCCRSSGRTSSGTMRGSIPRLRRFGRNSNMTSYSPTRSGAQCRAWLLPDQLRRIHQACFRAVFPAGTFKGRPIMFSSWSGYGANLPELQQAAAAAGHFNPVVDSDGVVRRVPILAEYNGAYYESLSLAMVRNLLGNPPLLPGLPRGEAKDTADWNGWNWIHRPAC